MAYEEGAEMWPKLYLAAPVRFRACSECCRQLGAGAATPTLITSGPVLPHTRGHLFLTHSSIPDEGWDQTFHVHSLVQGRCRAPCPK